MGWFVNITDYESGLSGYATVNIIWWRYIVLCITAPMYVAPANLERNPNHVDELFLF